MIKRRLIYSAVRLLKKERGPRWRKSTPVKLIISKMLTNRAAQNLHHHHQRYYQNPQNIKTTVTAPGHVCLSLARLNVSTKYKR